MEKELLVIKKLREDFVSATSEKNLSKSLSVADLSIWFACDSTGDILLTSDGMLRKMAKKHKLETHGLLWIFNEIVLHQVLPAGLVISKLEVIFSQNIYYRSNQKLMKAFDEMKRRFGV